MRPFFAFLGLVLCLIAARADELPVIKHSEAVQYLGENVEVRGLVVSVTHHNEICRSVAILAPTQDVLSTRLNPDKSFRPSGIIQLLKATLEGTLQPK
jgi:hypothetical protein